MQPEEDYFIAQKSCKYTRIVKVFNNSIELNNSRVTVEYS